MAEADLDKSLLSLESEAKRLAQASSKTNAIIQNVEMRLRTANIGVEFWLNQYPFSSGRPLWLGYAKIENEWHVAVKSPTQDAIIAALVRDSQQPPIPLLKTSREIRQEGLSLLPELIEGLRVTIAKRADALETAARRLAQ